MDIYDQLLLDNNNLLRYDYYTKKEIFDNENFINDCYNLINDDFKEFIGDDMNEIHLTEH
jgi:hypothetical protein